MMGADWVSRLPIPETLDRDEPSPHAAAKGGPTPSFLSSIANLSRLLTDDADLDTLLGRSVAGLVGALQGAACASIYLKHDEGDCLTLAAQCHQCAIDGAARKPRADLAAQVIEYVKPITLMVRQQSDAPFLPVLGLPIKVADRTLGALIIEADTRIYDQGDSALLDLFANQLALVVENRRLHRQLVTVGSLQASADEGYVF